MDNDLGISLNIPLRKIRGDLRKFEISKEDLLQGKKELSVLSDMELLEILIENKRLKLIEEKYTEVVENNLTLKSSLFILEQEVIFLENELLRSDCLISKLNGKLEIVYARNYTEENKLIKSKLDDLYKVLNDLIDKDTKIKPFINDNSDVCFQKMNSSLLHKKDCSIDKLDINTPNNSNKPKEIPSRENKIAEFLKSKNVTTEEELSEEDKFNFRFIKNR